MTFDCPDPRPSVVGKEKGSPLLHGTKIVNIMILNWSVRSPVIIKLTFNILARLFFSTAYNQPRQLSSINLSNVEC